MFLFTRLLNFIDLLFLQLYKALFFGGKRPSDQRLDKTDAVFLDVIHTSDGIQGSREKVTCQAVQEFLLIFFDA